MLDACLSIAIQALEALETAALLGREVEVVVAIVLVCPLALLR